MSLDVRKWLEDTGFGPYAELFQANEIDGDALVALTDAHLKELGLAIGPRAKLLKAIKALAISEPPRAIDVPAASATPPAAASSPATASSAGAERRQLTVMFVDLVGSTALSSRLDPEDLREVVRGYQQAVAAEIARFDGHIAQYLGDGVLAYFGYPIAHEDEAERAVRSAVAVLAAVAGRHAPGGEALAARVGIATGLVVVGDLIGEGSAKEHAVVGETPNLAARLQGLAEPGQVVLSAQTAELVGKVFELHDLGAQTLKGIAAPVRAFAVGAERSVESRFEAHAGSSLGRMVGRDGELAVLLERWRMAASGEGQTVLVSGEAGIGKSRLSRALQQALEGESHVRIPYQCSPYHTGSAMFPVIQQVTRAAGIRAGDDPETKLDRLEALLADTAAKSVADMALIAALLGIDGAQRYGPIGLTPPQQRRRTFEVLLEQPLNLSRTAPVLLVFEDAHWIDPSSLELLELAIERMSAVRVLIVVTARPEFRHDFGGRRDISRIALTRLGRTQAASLAQRVARGKELPEALLAEIALKADGVPLFVEELTKTMLESGLLRETANAFVVDGSRQRPAVPASLHDSLMARLDRLQSVKEVAQTAACIGRDFDHGLLGDVMRLPETELLEALDRLVRSELVYRRGTPPQVRYSFKHALLRDAAYESLLRAKRQQIHQRLVEALEAAGGAAPEIVAHHAIQAGLTAKAIDCLQQAVAQAVARPAFKEAVAHLEQALALADRMGDAEPWPERRLALALTLGQTLIPLRGYGHEYTVAAFTRAQALAEAVPRARHRNAIAYAVWSAHYTRGEQDRALEVARDMLARSEAERNPGHLVTALRSLAISQMISGSPALARESFAKAERLKDSVRERSGEQRVAVAQRFAADPDIATQFYVALTLWALGEVGQARRVADAALADARAMRHAHTLSHALAHASILAVVCRDTAQALALTGETLEFAARHDLEMFRGYGAILKAFALALDGETAGSVPAMEGGFDYMTRTQTGAMVPMHHALHARSLAALGRFEQAARHAQIAERELRSGSERFFWAETRRLLGDYLSLCPETRVEQVAGAYAEALEIARSQRARSWELYAALSLARLWCERGERAKALELLAPVQAACVEAAGLPAHTEAGLLLQRLR